MSDFPNLPPLPVDEHLDHFVRELYSPGYPYNISRVPDITSSFLDLVASIPRLYGTLDLDDYFQAAYRFLLEQQVDRRPSETVLRSFWADYSYTSRTQALEHTTKKLRHLEAAHRKACDKYQECLQACLRGDMTTETAQYKTAFAACKKAAARVDEFRQYCDEAAVCMSTVHTHGIYWGPEWGASPLVEDN